MPPWTNIFDVADLVGFFSQKENESLVFTLSNGIIYWTTERITQSSFFSVLSLFLLNFFNPFCSCSFWIFYLLLFFLKSLAVDETNRLIKAGTTQSFAFLILDWGPLMVSENNCKSHSAIEHAWRERSDKGTVPEKSAPVIMLWRGSHYCYDCDISDDWVIDYLLQSCIHTKKSLVTLTSAPRKSC